MLTINKLKSKVCVCARVRAVSCNRLASHQWSTKTLTRIKFFQRMRITTQKCLYFMGLTRSQRQPRLMSEILNLHPTMSMTDESNPDLTFRPASLPIADSPGTVSSSGFSYCITLKGRLSALNLETTNLSHKTGSKFIDLVCNSQIYLVILLKKSYILSDQWWSRE